jgi:hypothetical protein
VYAYATGVIKVGAKEIARGARRTHLPRSLDASISSFDVPAPDTLVDVDGRAAPT